MTLDSGHSILMVLCAMVWHTYYKWVRSSINWVKVSIWILAVRVPTCLLLFHDMR